MVAELGVKVVPRYLDVAGCAAYIGRMDKAVRHLVKQAAIPYAKIGRRVTFDTEKRDRWIERHGRRRKQLA